MKSICVFCGSSSGNHPDFIDSGKKLGQVLAENKIALVYGGSNGGIMGAVADSVLEHGGQAIGVLPKFLQAKEIAHKGLSEFHLCETMHERKTKMFELSEGFIALPGGFGTLEEIVEILTWGQLGLHKHPMIFLNLNGYYDHLKKQFEVMEQSQLLKPENRSMALFVNTVDELLPAMRAYQAPNVSKWISKDKT